MELLIAILLFIFVVLTTQKKTAKDARKTQAGSPAAKAPRAQQAAKRPVRAAVPEAKLRVEPTVKAAPAAAQGQSMLEDAECEGGSMEHVHVEGHSALEDAECEGGSMEHTHTEGVSRADHARRMAAIDARDAQAPLAEAVDARALRRAVVMAEVLGKPRALKRG